MGEGDRQLAKNDHLGEATHSRAGQPCVIPIHNGDHEGVCGGETTSVSRTLCKEARLNQAPTEREEARAGVGRSL